MPASLQPRHAMAGTGSRRAGERLGTVGRVVLVLVALLLVALIGAAMALPGLRDRIGTAWWDSGSGAGAGVLEAGDRDVNPGPDSLGPPGAQVMDYTRITGLPDGVVIRTPDSVDALSGAPQDFRDYLAHRISQVDPVSECPTLIGVQLVRTDGFAVGVLRGCGDVQVAWVKVNGVWRTVASAAEGLDCSVLARQKVPPAMADLDCPPARSALVTFRQAPQADSAPRPATASKAPSTTGIVSTADAAAVPPPVPTPSVTAPTAPSFGPSEIETPDVVPVPSAWQHDEASRHEWDGKPGSVCWPTKGQKDDRATKGQKDDWGTKGQKDDQGQGWTRKSQSRDASGSCHNGTWGAAQRTHG